MVAIFTRRALPGGILSAALCSSSVLPEDVAKFLCEYTPRSFREAVRNSGDCFLYRGEQLGRGPTATMGRICNPEPDLLVPGTYADSEALMFFQCLERRLESVQARPSTGHVGTSAVKDAAAWGDVVSVWPLGNEMSYVWPKDVTTFYPAFQCQDTSIAIDSGLEKALQDGREVLFASWYSFGTSSPTLASTSSFFAMPQKNDRKLRTILRSLNYGLS